MIKLSIKYLKWAQRAGGAGWNKHVGPWLRRKANKRLRRLLKRQFSFNTSSYHDPGA